MSNMKNEHDEYQYPGEEHVENSVQEPVVEEVHAEAKEEQQQGGILGFISRKRKALFLVLIVVAAFVAFKYMTANNAAPAPVEKPVVAAAPVVEQPNPQEESQIGRLAQVVAQNQQVVSQMQDQMDNMQNALSRANDSYQTTNDALKALTAQLEKVQAQLAPKPKAKPAKKVVPIVYHIKAIVPGRAWVLGSNGTAQSVSVGDNLQQYGRIVAINADSGVVMTSSGKVIEYGSGDF